MSHAKKLQVIKLFTVFCTALIFPVSIARAFIAYGVESGWIEVPVVLGVFGVALLASWKIIDRASVGVADPVDVLVEPARESAA